MNENIESIKIEIISGQAMLLDVREKEEWDCGHIAYATCCPLSKLLKGEIPMYFPKNLPLYTYCKRGVRAKKAQDILIKFYPKVKALTFGFEELKKANFSISYPSLVS